MQLGNEILGYLVAPFTGVWIETAKESNTGDQSAVAPFTGVWIETPGAAR